MPRPSLFELGDLILQVLPEDGSPISNKEALERVGRELGFVPSNQEYLEARDHMIVQGHLNKRRNGPGGLIYRIEAVDRQQDEYGQASQDWRVEENLYNPVKNYLALTFARDPAVDVTSTPFVAITASSRRGAQGRWSVPDLIMVTKATYRFFPVIDLDVFSFEVKTESGIDSTAPLQAFSQTNLSHYGYVVWHCANATRRREMMPLLMTASRKSHIGLVVMRDPLVHSTYEVVYAAGRHSPRTADIDQMLDQRLSKCDKTNLLKWVKGTEGEQ